MFKNLAGLHGKNCRSLFSVLRDGLGPEEILETLPN